ncbi:hypothetical protein P153DRAFT_392317 [Dothidotthia symphoricarpi CBS 119687]|uniref:GPI anchored protein n=1 Tax=Dothidotthia symphoricarpi CBS 119687 TaxID=1392245 RepID=A0A6A6AUZ8_9PLEO|nr:uncharacterized protein P153DRAFT_392317 [Dothidotthia symphoricarpi CBS 119687]KAF2135033.1 hypothetical protein P153DRAFT_392317 [Dothidotthia symphoricarpi CBS 119687]
MRTTTLNILLAISATTTHAIHFNGPVETPASTPTADLAASGWSPAPTGTTQSLTDIFRRQAAIDDAICGYIDGDTSRAVSCTLGDCYYNTNINWFGCCTGTLRSDCQISTRCVASASVASCLDDPECVNDGLVTACTASSRAFCGTMRSVVEGGTVTHLVCAAAATTVDLFMQASSVSGLVSSVGVDAGNSTVVLATMSSSSRMVSLSGISSASASASSSSSSSRASVSSVQSTSASRSASASQNAVTSASSAGAMKTAQAVAGAGGLVGLIALFF